MQILPGKLQGLFHIQPKLWEDDRGYFYEGYSESILKEEAGINFEIKQLNFSRSTQYVLRGLHFQDVPQAQSKLICCLDGEILDIAVDIRKGSPTYGQYEKVVLSGKLKNRFFVPKGFAHGFMVLSETAEIMYAVDNQYSKEHDGGIYFNDPALNIDWGTDIDRMLLSEKDKNLPLLKNSQNQFQYHD
jgi:dTDP-4-dehydrorhamnose 3,5-epimerase